MNVSLSVYPVMDWPSIHSGPGLGPEMLGQTPDTSDHSEDERFGECMDATMKKVEEKLFLCLLSLIFNSTAWYWLLQIMG